MSTFTVGMDQCEFMTCKEIWEGYMIWGRTYFIAIHLLSYLSMGEGKV